MLQVPLYKPLRIMIRQAMKVSVVFTNKITRFPKINNGKLHNLSKGTNYSCILASKQPYLLKDFEALLIKREWNQQNIEKKIWSIYETCTCMWIIFIFIIFFLLTYYLFIYFGIFKHCVLGGVSLYFYFVLLLLCPFKKNTPKPVN